MSGKSQFHTPISVHLIIKSLEADSNGTIRVTARSYDGKWSLKFRTKQTGDLQVGTDASLLMTLQAYPLAHTSFVHGSEVLIGMGVPIEGVLIPGEPPIKDTLPPESVFFSKREGFIVGSDATPTADNLVGPAGQSSDDLMDELQADRESD